MSSQFRAGDELWSEIQARARKTKSLIACVGYVGRHPADVLRWRKGDSLLADLSEENVRRGVCSAKGALKLLDLGVQVFYVPRLHAKVYLFDSSAVVCSANASEGSMRRREAGMVVSGEGLGAVRKWVASVEAHAETTRLDREFLEALAKIEPAFTGRGGGGGRKENPPEPEAAGRLWLINADEYDDETEDEATAARSKAEAMAAKGKVSASSDIEWFSGIKQSLFKDVKPGDSIAELWWRMVDGKPKWKLVGLYTCLLPVDLGERFSSNRYRLAVSGRAPLSKWLTENEKTALERAMKAPFTGFAYLGLPASAASIVRRLLGLKSDQ
jgi:hypothetical protein